MSSTGIETAIGRFVWHDHSSADAGKAKNFYGELFGWDFETFMPGEFDYQMISAGGKTHGGFGPSQGGAPPHWLGHVLVEDVDETAAKAEAAGGTIVAPAMDIPDVGRMVVIADPQGATISAFAGSGTGESIEAGGVFVWDELLTDDVEGAKSFYGEIFGWTAAPMDMGDMTYTIFKRGEADAAGCMAKPSEIQGPSFWFTYIGTEDVDATVEKAKSLGATIEREPTDIPNIGRFAVITDPTGVAFGAFKGNPESGS